jgi:NAD+-dependent protein deacetylase sirtuin 6
VSFQPTGHTCDACGGALCDTLLDWEDPLPEDDLDRATAHCTKADLVICLGTSLRIQPAGSMPTLAQQFVIVNLQETPEDQNAALVIHERVDRVVLAIMEHFGYDKDWSETDPPPVEYFWQPPPPSTDTNEEEEE